MPFVVSTAVLGCCQGAEIVIAIAIASCKFDRVFYYLDSVPNL